LTLFLGLGALFWTGSKSGWLIALALLGIWLFRLNWPARLKGITLLLLVVFGLTAFGIRFRNYFAAGATSVGARFDYWRAAVQTTATHPVFGTGPGTFQHPYAQIKTPEAEMARLAHNDYLEQFSDSGVIGGLAYTTWISLLFVTLGSRLWKFANGWTFAIFLGCLGWFLQGLSEFSLYVPALAWTAFLLAGSLLNGVHSGTSNRQSAPASLGSRA
jgi:O-antigen ligase